MPWLVGPIMTPDRAPTVRELLTFYLEAGVDCALMDEPANRLSDDDAVVVREAAQPSAQPGHGSSSLRTTRFRC